MIREFIAVALLLIIIVILVTLFLGAAVASTDCLTYHEARQQWPRHHLYWYTANHCWHYRRHYFRPVRKPFIAPAMLARAKEVEKPKEEKQPEDKCCWPKLERDKDGKIIEPPRTFDDRWNDQAWTRSLK